ncbi:hypothetical protein KC360_g122 [Hortaea werneckii]|nr:hypothetical protein KC344_g122 [Hortaea werneckii]KAI7180422.1 hypothetical protein KC360_g122 [Hortaea werneckii]
MLSWEHVDVLKLEWLHDIILDPVIQLNAGGTLKNNTCPVNRDTIFEPLSWLVHKRHSQDFLLVPVEHIETDWSAYAMLRVEKLVSKPSCVPQGTEYKRNENRSINLHAIVASNFVHEAIQKTVSSVIGGRPSARPVLPDA